jgi:hypothetical protein
MNRCLLALTAVLGLAGCASPEPILYPNDHLRAVGQQAAERDIAECRALAEQAGASAGDGKAERAAGRTVGGGGIGAAGGAVGGAIGGSPGTGAAIGAASGAATGLLSSLFSSPRPSGAYQNFVNRCLAERGYEPIGWE